MAVTIGEVIRHTMGQFVVDLVKGCPDFTTQADLSKREIVDLCQGDNRCCPHAGEVFQVGNKPTLPVTKDSPSIPQNGEHCKCTLREGEWRVISKIRSAIIEEPFL